MLLYNETKYQPLVSYYFTMIGYIWCKYTQKTPIIDSTFNVE